MKEEIDAAAVRRIRETIGVDQATFGHMIAVSERTVRGWEKGAAIPGVMRVLLAGVEAHQRGAFAEWGARFKVAP